MQKYSQIFAKTKKSAKKYDTINATLLTQAGFVNQLMAGVYTYLPLGLKVLRNIQTIVREEMDAIGGQEILMPTLHPSENWKQSGGWDGVDVLFKLNSRTGREYALGQSEEEVVTPLMKEYIFSWRDLPLLPYQIHWKFRDELRAKSGIMRGREFLMKDMYSLHESQAEFDEFYQQTKQAYLRIFKRMGLNAKATEASGGAFSQKISYEFMVITEAGEDDILYSQNSDYCINAEITDLKEGDEAPDGSGKLTLGRASEVGNVFDLGTKYQEAFDLKVQSKSGELVSGVMGCYGIGVSRLMGVIAEKFNDDKGLLWPKEVAPFDIHFITLKDSQAAQAEELIAQIERTNLEVLWDDRDGINAGEKFADADLIGIPVRVILSERSLENGGVEVKSRDSQSSEIVALDKLLGYLTAA